MSDVQTIWREGNRIRRTDGTGYSDRVTYHQILDHIEGNDGVDPLSVPFARAVLALRAFERASSYCTRCPQSVSS